MRVEATNPFRRREMTTAESPLTPGNTGASSVKRFANIFYPRSFSRAKKFLTKQKSRGINPGFSVGGLPGEKLSHEGRTFLSGPPDSVVTLIPKKTAPQSS